MSQLKQTLNQMVLLDRARQSIILSESPLLLFTFLLFDVRSSELLSVLLQISSMPHLLLAFLTVSNVIVVFGGADNCPPMDELTNILEKYTPEVNVVNRQKNDTSSSSTFR